MKFERGNPDNEGPEWSSSPQDAEPGLGHTDETKDSKKSKSSKKSSGTEKPSAASESKGKRDHGREWHQRIEQGEISQAPPISEGLIWLRAASKAKAEAPEAVPAADTAETPAAGQASEMPAVAPVERRPAPQAEQPELQAADDGGQAEKPDTDQAEQAREPEPAMAESVEPSSADINDEPVAPGSEEAPTEAAADDDSNPFERSYAPPPMPPDPSRYRQFFWEQQPIEDAGASQHGSLPPVGGFRYEAVAPAVSTESPAGGAPYTSETPPGLQRTPADVAQAAWVGLTAGWFFGRRNKRKAVEQAHAAGIVEGRTRAALYEPALEAAPVKPLEAQPLHSYPQVEASRVTVLPTAVETRRAQQYTQSPELPLVEAVARPAAKPEANTTGKEAPAPAPGAQLEHTMDRRELLRVAKTIKVDGIRLKDVFTAKRIDEAGLRAVVETYLRGGDIRAKLTEEVVNKEKSFELDPLTRHQRRNGESAVAGALAKATEVAREQGGRLAHASQAKLKDASKVTASSAKQAQHHLMENTDSVTWLGVTAVVIIWSAIILLLAHK